MPKEKSSIKSILNNYVKEFPEEFSTDGKILHCQKCQKSVVADRRSQLIQHRSTSIHQKGMESSVNQRQSHIQIPMENNDFNTDLCEAMISTDIPLYKLENKKFKQFLSNTQRKIFHFLQHYADPVLTKFIIQCWDKFKIK